MQLEQAGHQACNTDNLRLSNPQYCQIRQGNIGNIAENDIHQLSTTAMTEPRQIPSYSNKAETGLKI